MSYRPPELLGPSHVLDGFVCASTEQTDWLVRHGLRKGGGRYPQPVVLLARLGVHLEHEREGLGRRWCVM